MREIRFRALAPDKKGNLKWFDDVITDGQEVWIQTKHQGIGYLKEIKELVQYTGLKDKNGVEVFEGDVVSYDLGIDGEKPENYKIIFDNKQCAYFLFPLRDGARLRHFTYSAQSNCEVIGNIYEHKHLLGGE